MKRTIFLIIGYYLYFQAGASVLVALGDPTNFVITIALSSLCAWGGYALIQKAKALKPLT